MVTYKVQPIPKEEMHRWKTEIAGGELLRRYYWSWFCTISPRFNWKADALEREFKRFMSMVLPKPNYFYVIEPYRTSDATHLHCVIGPSGGFDSQLIGAVWGWGFGRNTIERFNKKKNCLDYICKRLANKDIQWGFRINKNERR